MALWANSCVDVVYIDFSKAFDSVVHSKLSLELAAYGFGFELFDWINPQMPKVKIHLRTPKGGRGGYHPPGFWSSRPNFSKIFLMGMFSGSRNPTVIMKKFYLYCMTLKIEVKHFFCMTFHISGCKHDTKLILVSILTFSRSRISKMLKTIP